MTNKRIISLACAGAIILAGVGGASAITAHNANRVAVLAEEESRAALTVTNSTSTTIDTTVAGTTAAPATVVKTTAADQGGSKTTSPPKTTAEVETTKITWTYDAALSKRVADQIVKKYPVLKYDASLFREKGPGNFIHDGVISTQNNPYLYINKVSKGDPAEQIVNAWSQLDTEHGSTKDMRFCVVAYRYSNNYYFVAFC